MSTPGNGRSGGPGAVAPTGAPASGADSSQRFGVAAPGASLPTGTSRVRAQVEGQEPEQPRRGRWQRLATWKKVLVFVVSGLILLGGGFLGGWIVMGPNVRALRLVHGVHAGDAVAAHDVAVVAVRGSADDVVPAEDKASVIGKKARTTLAAGTLINPRMLAGRAPPKGGKVQVGLALKPGQLPAGGLVAGDLVGAVTANDSQGNGKVTTRVLVPKAPVWAVNVPKQGDTVEVTLLVDRSKAAQLAAYSTAQPVSLVRVGNEQQ